MLLLLLNCMAAPLIILDFGTATTFCVVNEKGEYLGGAIAPGVGISLNALIEKTAQLPKVEMIVPDRVIGRNTINAIQSGLLYGYCGWWTVWCGGLPMSWICR